MTNGGDHLIDGLLCSSHIFWEQVLSGRRPAHTKIDLTLLGRMWKPSCWDSIIG